MSLRLGISQYEKVALGNEKILEVDSFTYLGSIINKDVEGSEDVRSRILKAHGIFPQVKNVRKSRRRRLQTRIGVLEATVITVVKYSSRIWELQETEEDLLDVFQRNCLRIVLGTRLTDRALNGRLYGKCGSNLLSRAIIRIMLKYLGYVLRMKDERLPNIVLFGQPSRAKLKVGRPRFD